MANTRVTNPVTGFKSATEKGLKLPSGTNANQPSGVQGMIRNDTGETTGSSASAIEHHNGTAWQYFAATESPDNPFLASQNFNTVLYIGDGNTSNPQTNIGFSPDLVWIVDRYGGNYNPIQDSVRGVDSVLVTALNAAEQSSSWRNSYGQITSFDSDGFNVSDGSGNTNSNFNQSGRNYVAWCFKAGGAAVANTDGSITSQVSANVAGGFSIVSWSGNSVSPSTVGHGLGVAPELFIIKNLSSAVNWSVYSSSVGVGFKLLLNEINQASATSNYANTSPTSSVFSLSGGNEVNGSGSNYIAYCFHSVAGYSKVGSYTGNGLTTNGPVINFGFEPSWIMIKSTSFDERWVIYDNKRSTSNPRSKVLTANSTSTEIDTAFYDINFTATGFTVNGTAAFTNRSGETYIYYAIA